MNQLAQYNELKTQIATMKEACNFLPDVASDEGYSKSKRVALDAGKILTAVEKTRKALKADCLEMGRTIDTEAKSIVAEVEAFQLPHKEAYKELDNLKKEREKARKDGLEVRVEAMRNLPEDLRDSCSEEVKAAYEEVMADECTDYYEFTEQALKARNSTRDALASLFERKEKEEADAIELANLRKAQEAADIKARDERIKAEAKQEAEAATRKAEADKQAAVEAKLKAQQEAADAAERAVEAAKQAEIKAKLQAERAAAQAERDKAEAVEAEIQRATAKQIEEDEEREKREANKRHVGSIRKAAKEAMIAGGIDEATAKKVILAISNGAIPHITINY